MSSDSAAHSYASGVAAYAYACAEAAAAPAPAAYHAWQYHHESHMRYIQHGRQGRQMVVSSGDVINPVTS